MAATQITVANSELWYGTAAEIALLANTPDGVNIGDVGWASDTNAEYTCEVAGTTAGTATWTITRQNTVGGAADTNLATAIAGERNSDSATNSYTDVRTETNVTYLTTLTAKAVGSSAAANDTMLMGAILKAAATAVVVTIAGFEDDLGAAKNLVLTGNDSDNAGFAVDKVVTFGGCGLINSFGTMTATVTTGAAGDVILLWRPL